MEQPSWKNPKLGTMKRAALWLVEVVGEGKSFTKAQLRDAFPDTAQIDRRMRDLRDYGWRIDTNREDLSLGMNEQRFVKQGEPVWEPGKATKASNSITATRRREIMSRDGHLCRACGIAPGQNYAGSYEAAQLDIARREVIRPDGTTEVALITECNRCRVGGRKLTADVTQVIAGVQHLGAIEQSILVGWIAEDRREFSALETLWADYRTLPEEARAMVRDALNPS
ncbi:hypothetical protein ACFYYR_03285 [Streptomyces sp. NPDC001922]|uniref:hypothetical protein n=1 Tax=Streptomyces sp. NPDC001922 TaxID=3364624 RepID=UPI00368AB4BA